MMLLIVFSKYFSPFKTAVIIVTRGALALSSFSLILLISQTLQISVIFNLNCINNIEATVII